MPGPLKTEAIVLRSIGTERPIRILHLYTPGYGRLSAIARGARRSRSPFRGPAGAVLHVRAMLHEGRGDLLTVTGVDTITVHAAVRDHAVTLDAASRACDAVSRLFETLRSCPDVFRLLANELALLQADVAARPGTGGLPAEAALLAAGIGCPAGGVRGVRRRPITCRGLLRGPPAAWCAAPVKRRPSPLHGDAYRFLVDAWAPPLAQAPEGSERVLRQVERAIGETAEHHAQVRLRPLLAGARA